MAALAALAANSIKSRPGIVLRQAPRRVVLGFTPWGVARADPCEPLELDHELAAGVPAGQEFEGVGGVFEGEGVFDRGGEGPVGQEVGEDAEVSGGGGREEVGEGAGVAQ